MSVQPFFGIDASVLSEILEVGVTVTEADFGNIQLVDPETGDLKIVAQRGFPRWWLEFWDTIGKGQGVCATAIKRGERVIVQDVEIDPIFTGAPAALEVQRKAGVRAVHSTPIVSRSGNCLGMFSAHYKTPWRPDVRALRLFDLLARQAADFIDLSRAEIALRESEQRLTLALDAAQMGTFDWNLVTEKVLWSEETEAIWGLSAGGYEGTYEHWKKLVHPDDIANAEALAQRALDDPDSPYELEHRIVWPDGTVRWILARSTTVRDDSLQPIRMVGVNMDITERKEAEEQLERMTALMSETQRISHVCGWRMDVQSGRGEWTPETFRIFGVQPETFEVTASSILSLFHPDDRPGLQGWHHVARKGENAGTLEFRVIRPDGSIRTILGQGELATAAQGMPQALLGTVQDITERKLAEEKERLLTAEVNHRARNLLAVVQALALQTSKVDDPKEFVQAFNERLAGLAASHDLLVEAEWHGVDTASLIRAQLTHFADLIGTRIVLDGPPILLRSSAAQNLGIALRELATNASKYGGLSSPSGMIHVSWSISGNTRDAEFEISWKEQNGPAVMPPSRLGFGRSITVDMLEFALAAQVSVSYESTGLIWQMRAPAGEITEPPKTIFV
jgi:PAS domain S-box-containing protein